MTDSATRVDARLERYRHHSDYTNPGRHVAALRDLAIDAVSLHRTVTNAIDHYRATPGGVAPTQMADIDRRWVSSQLDALAERQPGAFDAARPAGARLGGCCRDHSLLAVTILRAHGVPARTRLGFAGYFTPGYFHDHVVVERWDPALERWRRFDPELDPDGFGFAVDDVPADRPEGFRTAARAWADYREGRTDLADHGVAPDSPFAGPAFVQGYLIADLAHRQRSELLLWDGWGGMADLGSPLSAEQEAAADRLADLTDRADAGDPDAEHALDALWAADPDVRPGRFVQTFSPRGCIGRTDLERRVTEWRDPDAGPGA